MTTAAKVEDRDGGHLVLANAQPERSPEMLAIFANATYPWQLERLVPRTHAVGLEIVPKREGYSTLVVPASRWVAERLSDAISGSLAYVVLLLVLSTASVVSTLVWLRVAFHRA